MRATRGWWFLVMCGLWTMAVPVEAGTSNSLLDISADGKLLATVNRDNGTVSLVDLATNTVLREIPVGHKPEGVSFVGDSSLMAVTVYADDKVVFVESGNGQIINSVDVFDEPYGVVSNKAGTKVYVTLEYPGQLLEIDVASGKISQTIPGGRFLRGIALSSDEKRVFVTEYLTGAVNGIDLASGRIVDVLPGSSSDNIARQVALHPTRPKAYVPHIRSRINVNQGEGSIVPILTVHNFDQPEPQRNPVPMDSFIGTFVVANPWETAISPDGQTCLTVFAGTDDMFVAGVLDDNYREIEFQKVLKVGHNPRAVRYAPDGKTFYVYNTLDFDVWAYSATTFARQAVIPVCTNPLGDEILLGKILFYTALQPVVGRRWISCSSCHPDGDGDGRTWQNPEGLRNTTALYGMAWTHPLHWSADRDETQDFEHTIRGKLMQGEGLLRGPLFPAMGKPLKGLSPKLDALAAYSNSHKLSISPHSKNGLSEAAKRGKEIFSSAAVGCAKCHTGPCYTDSRPERPYKLHDVGTGNDDPSELMGSKYDTPMLLNLYRSAPYLHHGKAATLLDVLTTANKQDLHGRTSQLKAGELSDLVEFLKALPYEDAEAEAEAAGLTKIDR